MHYDSRMRGAVGRFPGRQQILAVAAILGSMCAVAGAQIDVNETGLHDNAGVYGIRVLGPVPPYLNQDDISVWAWGERDPNLYPNVAFSAFGLHGEANLTNTGSIGVNTRGGNAALTAGPALAYIWDSIGIFTLEDANNAGDITVTAMGGTAVASGSYFATASLEHPAGVYAREGANNSGDIAITAIAGAATSSNSNAYAYILDAVGIHAEENLQNTGDIAIVTVGGAANAGNEAFAYSNAMGLFTEKDANNTGTLSITAIGGSASADGEYAAASAGARAYGIDTYWDIDNRGALTIAVTGGMATAGRHEAEAVGTAYGLRAGIDVVNTGDITALGAGGTADGNDVAGASAWTYGASAAGMLDNTGRIDANAVGGIATAHLGAADANAYAYGAEAGGGGLNNSGVVNANATGGAATSGTGPANADGLAYAIKADDGNVTNSGAISATATGGTADATGGAGYADAHGEAYGGYSHYDLIANSGQITVAAEGGRATADNDANVAAIAFGVLADSGGADNSGDIAATALGGTADAGSRAIADAIARGLAVDGDAQNTGDFSVAAAGGTATTTGSGDIAYAYTYTHAYGISAPGMADNTGNMTIAATGGIATADRGASPFVAAFADVFANAIVADNGVTNSGNLTVTATGATAVSDGSALAGVVADGIWTGGTLTNSGNVTSMATGGTAAGSYARAGAQASGMTGLDLINTAAVTVIATGGIATAAGVADTSSYAEGIAAGTVNNTGAVFVAATAGTSDGTSNQSDADAVGIIAGGDVYNTGPITVAATAGEGSASSAYGIRVDSAANLTNTGIIRAAGDTAYELYIASGTTTLADTYNVTLDGDPGRGSLGIADEATLALNDATLAVTALSGETLWNTQYRLFETEGAGAVDGNFADVQAANPNTTVTYYDQGTAGSADDTVSLAYTPAGSPAFASAGVMKQAISQAGDVVNRHMTTTLLQNILSPPSSGLLASAGSTAESRALVEAASDETAGVFVEPYYSRIDRDADPLGFDARLWGFSAGFERYIGDTLVSLHAGYGQSDIGYTGSGYGGNSEDQDVVTAGVTGLTRWDPWTLRYGLTGFYGWHDYQGLTGLALDEHETASYDSYGTAATLMAGRIVRRGRHVLLPEAGLNWLWAHRRRYTTEATDPSWNTVYSALDDHDLQAVASLRWLSSFRRGDVRVSPSVAIGVRHLLTDAETGVWQSIAGAAPVLVESEQDRTALTLSGSLVLTRTPHALSLTYDGDFSENAQRHSLWLRFSWLF